MSDQGNDMIAKMISQLGRELQVYARWGADDHLDSVLTIEATVDLGTKHSEIVARFTPREVTAGAES